MAGVSAPGPPHGQRDRAARVDEASGRRGLAPGRHGPRRPGGQQASLHQADRLVDGARELVVGEDKLSRPAFGRVRVPPSCTNRPSPEHDGSPRSPSQRLAQVPPHARRTMPHTARTPRDYQRPRGELPAQRGLFSSVRHRRSHRVRSDGVMIPTTSPSWTTSTRPASPSWSLPSTPSIRACGATTTWSPRGTM